MNLNYINLTAYPLDHPESSTYQALVAEQKALLASKGMINLEGFLTVEGVRNYKQEIEDRMDVAYHAVTERHPYGYQRSEELPDDHPCNTFSPTENFRLARHLLPDTAIDALYCWSPMRRFIADITGNRKIYLSGDPSNGLVVQVYKQGCGLAWHFDQALFSTVINLSETDAGGFFECAPNLRSETEPNYDEVKAVLDGHSLRIQQHKVKAGSFSIMLGRYTMHRVTEVEAEKPRISVILSYELQPGLHMDLATRKISFGPTAPELP